MSIFNRISDIFKANINDTLDKAEDPEKMLKQMVLEMEESINKTTLAVANAIANEKGLEHKLEKAKNESNDWEQKAMFALQSGKEDLAKAALEKKTVTDKNIADLQPIFTQAKTTSDNLRTQLNQLKAKLDEARAREGTLIARSQAAKAQKQVAQALGGIGSDAFSKFDKYEQKIEGTEAEAEAFEQLAGENTDLDQQFKELTTGADVDAQLLALKGKMGMLPPTTDTDKK